VQAHFFWLIYLRKDKTRIQKSLHTAHPTSTLPVLQQFNSEYLEGLYWCLDQGVLRVTSMIAQFIAAEVKRLVAEFGGVLNWNDFAILCISLFLSF
jgi:DNA helicase II / ATP-dependent DNA helicase PcrA